MVTCDEVVKKMVVLYVFIYIGGNFFLGDKFLESIMEAIYRDGELVSATS